MRNLFPMIGIFSMLGMFLLFYATFSVAFFSPAKAVLIDINSYGEAEVEFILLSLFIPLNILSAVAAARKVGGKENTEQKERDAIYRD